MVNENIIVCELSDYAPSFYGNFMYSLINLENLLKLKNPNNKLIYAFYENSIDCYWIKEMQQNNKTIFFLKSKYLKGFFQLKKIIIKNNINVLHSHFTIPIFLFFLLRIFFPKIIIISHFHNLFSGICDLNHFKKKIKTKIKLFFYNKNIIDIFCGCSEAVSNDLKSCEIKNKKCLYIDNSIDFSRFDKVIIQDNYSNITNGKQILIIYGTYFYTKGVDIAINAIKDIAKIKNIILMIICQNKEYVLNEINKILNIIPEWVLIVPSKDNIAEYLNIGSIYLTPSREEGFSYLMLEAIYCENIVIRSNLQAMNRNLPYDFVVPVNDSDALRQCIESVLSFSDDKKKTIICEQKKYIMQNWNIDIWSNNIINMYLDQLNK